MQPNEPLTPGGPLKLTPAQRVELGNEVAAILDEHRSDTSEFQRQIITQRRLYEMKGRRKTWPWIGAANFIMPIIRYTVDQYKGRIQQTYRQSPHLWHGNIYGVEETDEDTRNWKQIAEDAAHVADYLSRDPSHLNLFERVDDIVDAISKDGTVGIKVHFVSRTKKRAIRRGNTTEVIDEPYIDRVEWDVIDIQRMVWTIGGSEPDDMPVIGHWMEMTRGQLRALATQFDIPKADLENVLKTPDDPWYVQEERTLDEEMGISRESTVVRTLAIFRIHELTVEWPLKDDEPPALMTVWWHQGSHTLLRVFDPQDYAKPWEIARFLKRGRQFLGSGVSESLRVLNLGANTIVNQTVDAQTISNAYGFLYKADSAAAAFLQQSGLFPGVKIPVTEDVDKEFKSFQLGAANTSISIELLQFILQLSEMVGKIGPSQMGNVSAGSRTAASVGLGILQEGSQMVDSVIARLKDTMNRCMLRTLLLYANHRPEVFDDALPRERATALLEAIKDPGAQFPLRVRVSLAVSSAAANREKDKQDLIVLANFLFNVFDKIIQSGMLAANPQAPPPVKQLIAYVYEGMSEVIRQLVGQFDQFRDPGRALPPEILQLLQQLATMTPAAGVPGAPGAAGAAGAGGPVPDNGIPRAALQPEATGGAPPAAAMGADLMGALGG